jgi:homoserine kinase
MTGRRRLVRVPASSANLGPGYDVLAAALDIHLELEVSEVGEFVVDAGGEGLPAGRDNVCVRAFEDLHSADGLRFEIRSEIPVARGLGSSAAAIVAGLLAADHMFELGLDPPDVYRRAVELEGHPDNVAAALFGGFAVTPPDPTGDSPVTPVLPARLEPPQGVEGVLAIPRDEVPTEAARAALPEEVPMADTVANIAAAAHLVLGIERSDLTLISRGLSDSLHQERRADVYPRAIELLALGDEVGAIGATVSGAGPSVLFWCFWQDTGKVVDALGKRTAEGVEIRRARFTPLGADVPEL